MSGKPTGYFSWKLRLNWINVSQNLKRLFIMDLHKGTDKFRKLLSKVFGIDLATASKAHIQSEPWQIRSPHYKLHYSTVLCNVTEYGENTINSFTLLN